MISGTRKFGSNWILIQKIFESKICVAWKKIRFKKNWELFWIESLKSKLYTLNMIMANYISSWKTSSICSTSTWHVSVIGIFYQYMWCYNRSFIRTSWSRPAVGRPLPASSCGGLARFARILTSFARELGYFSYERTLWMVPGDGNSASVLI